MRLRPSLLLRLSILVLCAQIAGAVLVGLSDYARHLWGYLTRSEELWGFVGADRAEGLVAGSLVERSDGSAALELSEKLRAYVKAAPRFRYGAVDLKSGALIPGSAPEFVDAMKFTGAVQPEYIGFRIEKEPGVTTRGLAQRKDTEHGSYLICYAGWTAGAPDLWSDFLIYEESVLKWVMPTLCATLCVGWLALRRGLAPLKNAADEARRIDLDSLDQRLATRNIPIEILPLVETINEALSRLDDGISRQTRFLANAAHELRTPVMILGARAAGSEKSTFKKDIERDARRIRNIVEQLLAFARLGKSASPLEDEMDLSEIVPAMVDDYALLAVKNDRRVEYEGTETPLHVRGERRTLESVIANLIDNALRAEPEGGTVVIRLSGDATIAVVDHGEGVALEDREMIFEPFWRKNASSGGTGLGLAIAKELVEERGGRIWLEDTPGGGATFKVSFPNAQRETTSEEAPS